METDKIYLGDCYQLIKDIPDKSIDLVYIDIPYLYKQHGGGKSPLGQRTLVKKKELSNIDSGIDYSILDELCRTMKYIYIYMVQQISNK